MTLICEGVETKEYEWLFMMSDKEHGGRFRKDSGNKYTLIIREEMKKLMEAIKTLPPKAYLIVLGPKGLFLN